MKQLILFSIAVFAVIFNIAPAHSNIDVYNFSSKEKQEIYQNLTKELRCPKCQNQDIRDSNAPIASDMRQEVFTLVENNKTHKEIIDHMVERFGEFVTYKPKVGKETFLLWYGPWIFAALGLVVILSLAARQKSMKNNNSVSNEPEQAKERESVSFQTKHAAQHETESEVNEILALYANDRRVEQKPNKRDEI